MIPGYPSLTEMSGSPQKEVKTPEMKTEETGGRSYRKMFLTGPCVEIDGNRNSLPLWQKKEEAMPFYLSERQEAAGCLVTFSSKRNGRVRSKQSKNRKGRGRKSSQGGGGGGGLIGKKINSDPTLQKGVNREADRNRVLKEKRWGVSWRVRVSGNSALWE